MSLLLAVLIAQAGPTLNNAAPQTGSTGTPLFQSNVAQNERRALAGAPVHVQSFDGVLALEPSPCGELSDEDIDAMSHYGDAIKVGDVSAEARWGAALLDAELKEDAAIKNVAVRADCYGGDMLSVQGPQAIYYMMKAGDVQGAWQYARKLMSIWNKYRHIERNEKDDYAYFPIGITHAIHYKCNPFYPDGTCPWPPPDKVINATVSSLLH
jgi:hypothetical protein